MELWAQMGFKNQFPSPYRRWCAERDNTIQEVSEETPDISEYLDVGLYDEVWYKDNAGTSPYEPERWLDMSQRTDRLMT